MNDSEFFTLLGFEAHRILLHALAELADLACLDGYQLTVWSNSYSAIVLTALSSQYWVWSISTQNIGESQGRRNRWCMIQLSDMPQYLSDRFRFGHESDDLHFAAAAWAKQWIDFENFGKQHSPDWWIEASWCMLFHVNGIFFFRYDSFSVDQQVRPFRNRLTQRRIRR